MPKTLYMVVEHFKNKDAVSVYRRFRDSGRMAPEGLCYLSSWVHDNLERCYQLMETHDRRLLDDWMANWSDLIDFEVSRNHIERGGGEDRAATIGLYSEPTQRSLFFQLILLLFWMDGQRLGSNHGPV